MKPLFFIFLLSISSVGLATDYCNQAKLHLENIDLCIDDNIPQDVAFGCGEADLRPNPEFYCLHLQSPPEVAKKCANQNLTEKKEGQCIIKETVEYDIR